ncbi:MAG TPA: 3-hydroxyisobutyrate dehydrogenase [Anaeromyxobacteraceae bacterium]|nr:3-hydroxyisobutyrate dehydrogenase [Anaeromyxobacteraceae bacterium]
MHVSFLGLGNMGLPMARNLLKGGYSVRGFDIAPTQVKRFADAGGLTAGGASEAVHEAEVVFTMLPASQHVRDLYLGAGGLLATCRPDALLVDCSTIAPAVAREVAAASRAKGIGMLDAPVSGGTGGAETGTLTFMVGGGEKDLERARPLLERMGKNIFHAGASGAGQAVKMCNNMLLGIQMAGTCEALRLGIAHGLDPARLSEIMTKSSGRNWALETYNPCPGVMPNAPASRGYTGGFSTDLMLKDLSLAQEGAASSNTATPLGRIARELYLLHRESGNGGRDFSSIFEDAAASAEILARMGAARG